MSTNQSTDMRQYIVSAQWKSRAGMEGSEDIAAFALSIPRDNTSPVSGRILAVLGPLTPAGYRLRIRPAECSLMGPTLEFDDIANRFIDFGYVSSQEEARDIAIATALINFA